MHQRWLMLRLLLSPEGTEGGGSPNPQPSTAASSEAKFTQADVDRMIGGRIASEKKAVAEAQAKIAELETKAAAAAELAAKVEALETASLSTAEKAKRDAERAQKALETERQTLAKERDEWKAKATAAEQKRIEAHVSREVGDALSGAKALPGVLKHAIPAFRSEVEIDTDEDGKITAVRYDGVARKDLAEAAAVWLAANPHFASHPGGGSGGQRPNGSGGGPGLPLKDQTSEELFAGAFARK